MKQFITTLLLSICALTANAQKPDPNFYILDNFTEQGRKEDRKSVV